MHFFVIAAFELDSVWGRGTITTAVRTALFVVAWILGRVASRTFDDPQQSYNARRLIRTAAPDRHP